MFDNILYFGGWILFLLQQTGTYLRNSNKGLLPSIYIIENVTVRLPTPSLLQPGLTYGGGKDLMGDLMGDMMVDIIF